MDTKRYSKYFKAFGDPSRLNILRLLTAGEMTVGEIVARVRLSQPTISRHLAVLREAGIVVDRREGQKVYYRLNKDAVQSCCDGFCDCLCVVDESEKKKKKK